jgi:hypothetical protein
MVRSRPLVVVFRPRQIAQFEEAIIKIKADKLHINYFPQHIAYPLARIEFLKREEYTHFVLVTDDLIVTPRDYDLLKGECNDYDVISGWGNNWLYGPWAEYSSVSFSMPPYPPSGGTIEDYHFTPIKTLEAMLVKGPIVPVPHQGTMFTFLKREIVERIPFRHDCGCCVDALLSHDLAKQGIKQYVDLRVRMLHLKDSAIPVTLVGKKPSEIVFEPA